MHLNLNEIISTNFRMDSTVVIILAIVVLILLLLNLKEGYANQVVHAGVGGIAGPMMRYEDIGEIPYRWTY